jgi:precorrin-4 C11-methyltransferase
MIKAGSSCAIVKELFPQTDAIVFIGALGICVRAIAPCLKNKQSDPAVVCIDSTGKYVIPVVSGHVGGSNELSRELALLLGGEPIITTQSDNAGLWPLDTLGKRFGWGVQSSGGKVGECIALFVKQRPTALLLDIRDEGTDYLERTCPAHVRLFYRYSDIPQEEFGLLITVGPFRYEASIPVIGYYPPVLHLGFGCRKQMEGDAQELFRDICEKLASKRLSALSVKDIATIDLKKDEPILRGLAGKLGTMDVPNPSKRVFEATRSASVAEAAALKASGGGPLLLEKQKESLGAGREYTFAVALDRSACRRGHIEIVGAGPGDPCIYGAIQEQMAFFDRHGMSYHITPGISSFQAAAAALRSQFTIPGKVQTILLTRGEGRTPMPEKEQLSRLAASQSTMCIFLSAGIAGQVQEELLVHYPPETPVAACYKLTWKDERIYRGQLSDLAKIVEENNLTLTTLLVVGDAVDNREGLSRLYADDFKHLFRP